MWKYCGFVALGSVWIYLERRDGLIIQLNKSQNEMTRNVFFPHNINVRRTADCWYNVYYHIYTSRKTAILIEVFVVWFLYIYCITKQNVKYSKCHILTTSWPTWHNLAYIYTTVYLYIYAYYINSWQFIYETLTGWCKGELCNHSQYPNIFSLSIIKTILGAGHSTSYLLNMLRVNF